MVCSLSLLDVLNALTSLGHEHRVEYVIQQVLIGAEQLDQLLPLYLREPVDLLRRSVLHNA